MAVTFLVRRTGDVLLSWGPDHTRELRTLPENRALRCQVAVPRSRRQDGRFFAALHEVVSQGHWPESHDFQPVDAEHLRAWLLVKVGHVEKPFDEFLVPDGVDPMPMALAIINLVERVKGKGRWAFPSPRPGAIRVYVPKTMNWQDVDKVEFQPLVQAMCETVEQAIGTTIDQILYERSQRARTMREALEEEAK